MEISEGCAKFLFAWLIVTVVGVFVVLPFVVFFNLREGSGWGYLLVSLGVFSYFVAEFFDLDENRIFNIIYYIFMSFATMLLLRDLFVTDVEAGLELVLSVPSALLVFFYVYEPLSRGMSEEGQEWLLKGLGLLGNLIVNGLIFLILKYLLPQ